MFASSVRWHDIDTMYLDLDGTLVDVSARYYRLHCDLCTTLGLEPLPFQLYWDLKRQKSPLEQILPETPPPIREVYTTQWLSLIESPDYLEYDCLLPSVLETLSALAGKYRLVLATMRHDRRLMEAELARLALTAFFEQIVCRSGRSDTRAKWQLICGETEFNSGSAIIVGDSEQDILAGKKLGLGTIAVVNGIRTQMLLHTLEPDVLIQHIGELPKLLTC